MEKVQYFLAKLLQEIYSPGGGRNLMLGGILITVFGFIGAGIGSWEVQISAQGSAGFILKQIFQLIMFLIFFVGFNVASFGFAIALVQNPKVKNEVDAPWAFTPDSLRSVTPARDLSIKERRMILLLEIDKFFRQGYRVVSQTDTTAELVKSKEFSYLWFFINAILIIGWIFYLLWYWLKNDKQVDIEVDENGNVRTLKKWP